jgi:hypothetical protein
MSTAYFAIEIETRLATQTITCVLIEACTVDISSDAVSIYSFVLTGLTSLVVLASS